MAVVNLIEEDIIKIPLEAKTKPDEELQFPTPRPIR